MKKLFTVGVLLFFACASGYAQTSAIRELPGFSANELQATDDGSTASIPLGFAINFFGTTYSSVFVNNNGNVTFDDPLSSFTPFELPSTGRAIAAPFFADVDTSGSGSAIVTYGTDVVDGRPAFAANWVRVGYYNRHSDKLNSFQIVIIDRSDLGTGNFDFEFNYARLQWEAGDASGGENGLGGSSARVGYSGGSGQPGTFFEFLGSGVPSSFLDGTRLVRTNSNTTVRGRHLFRVRGGIVLAKQNDSIGIALPIEPPPPSDEGDPEQVSGVFFEDSADTSNATKDPSDPTPPCGSGSQENSTWYVTTPEEDGTLDVSTEGSDHDTILSVWSGQPGNLSPEACNDDAEDTGSSQSFGREQTTASNHSSVTLPVQAGTTYYTMVSSATEGGGTLALNAVLEEEGSPIEPANFQRVTPHTATGGGFLTRTHITNLAFISHDVRIERFSQAGQLLEAIETRLLPGASVLITSPEERREESLSIVWSLVRSASPISVTQNFEFDSESLGLTENFRTAVGALATAPCSSFTFPLRVATVDFTVGLALANIETSENRIDMALVDENGVVVAIDSVTLAPFAQTAFPLHERAAFRDILLGVPEFIGSLAVATADPGLSTRALVIGNNRRQLFSLPVTCGTALDFSGIHPQIQVRSSTTAGSSRTTPPPPQALSTPPSTRSSIPNANFVTFIPHSITGGGFLSRLFVTDISGGSSNNLTINRIDQRGTVVETINRTLPAAGTQMIADSEDTRTQDLDVHWLAIGSDGPIVASMLFSFDSRSLGLPFDFRTDVGILGESRVFSSAAAAVDVRADVAVGVAYANPLDATIVVNLKLFDQAGFLVAQDSITLEPFGQIAYSLHDPVFLPEIGEVLLAGPFLGWVSITTDDGIVPVVIGNYRNQLYSLPVTTGIGQ